jgi:toxin YoeB
MEVRYWKKALDDIEDWKKSGNKAVQKKITKLVDDIKKTPYTGIGKPEALKYRLFGKWSRKITEEHRLVYNIEDGALQIYSMKGHYNDLYLD